MEIAGELELRHVLNGGVAGEAAAERGEPEPGELDTVGVGLHGRVETHAGDVGSPGAESDAAALNIRGDQIIVIRLERGVTANLNFAVGTRGDAQHAAELTEREVGVKLHRSGVVDVLEGTRGFDAGLS